MSMVIKGSRLLLLSIFVLSGCKGVEDISMTGRSGVEFKGIEDNTISLSAVVGVSNPSSASFRVSEVNLKTLVDGNFLGTLTTTDRIRIPAHSDSSYHMNFSLNMANILSGASFLYSISRKKQVNLGFQGYVKARSWLVVKKTEINESRLVDVPSLNQ